jgi:EAL domain-containing protein (putative c-di-GMP-specific phosphodiesterase class I)
MASGADSEASASEAVLIPELARALAEHQYFLLYQPTMDLQNGAFVGVEALLRWRHPVDGVVPPDRFLPALERSGAIVEVGAWVVGEACRQGAEWHARGSRMSVSVNVSRRQLQDPDLPRTVERALDATGFDAGHLVLELSEQFLAEQAGAARDQLDRLRALGVRIAVDDFGARIGSASVLRGLPVDIVKIDRSVVAAMSRSPEDAARVHELVQVGKSLGIRTIAQGIEDDDQRLALQVEDVDVGQGFLFSVPHDAEEIDRFLEDFAIFSGEPI